MPYVDSATRQRLTAYETSPLPQTPGELNYVLTRICDRALAERPKYADLNAVVGALECAKAELIRRVVAPYEDARCVENGDVYRERSVVVKVADADYYNDLRSLVEWVDACLDADVVKGLAQNWVRVAKVAEEVGEAIDALIGITGQNPRKGTYGSVDDLLSELADVALTGMYAIQHFTKDADRTMSILLGRATIHRTRLERTP